MLNFTQLTMDDDDAGSSFSSIFRSATGRPPKRARLVDDRIPAPDDESLRWFDDVQHDDRVRQEGEVRYRRNRDSLDDPAVAERAEQWLAKLRKEDEAEQQRRVEEEQRRRGDGLEQKPFVAVKQEEEAVIDAAEPDPPLMNALDQAQLFTYHYDSPLPVLPFNDLPDAAIMNIFRLCMVDEKEAWTKADGVGGLLSYLNVTKRRVCKKWNEVLNNPANLAHLRDHRELVHRIIIDRAEVGTEILIMLHPDKIITRKYPCDLLERRRPFSTRFIHGVTSSLGLFESEILELHWMTLKEDLMNCLAEQLSLYPKIQHLEINSDLAAHHMLPNVDLSSITGNFEKLLLPGYYITNDVIQATIEQPHKMNYEIVADQEIANKAASDHISMNNFERIRLFHDYTCEAPFEGVLDAIERAVANPFKRKWKLGLTNNATGFAEYAEVKTRARAYDLLPLPENIFRAISKDKRVKIEVYKMGVELHIIVTVKGINAVEENQAEEE